MRSTSLPMIVVLAGAATLLPALTSAQTPSASVSQPARTYKVKMGRKEVGWERFQITKQDKNYGASSTSELNLGGVQYSIATSAQIENGEPTHYSIDVKHGKNENKYTIEFKYGEAVAKIESGHRSGERVVPVGANVTLLDNNVWYQYQFLIAKYDMMKGGVQRFNAFTAYPALREYSALVEFQEEKEYKFGSQKVNSKVFGVELGGGFQLLVTVDNNGVVLEIEIPAQDEKITLEPQ